MKEDQRSDSRKAGRFLYSLKQKWKLLELNVPFILVIHSGLLSFHPLRASGKNTLEALVMLCIGIALLFYTARTYFLKSNDESGRGKPHEDLRWYECALYVFGMVYFWPIIFISRSEKQDKNTEVVDRNTYWMQVILSSLFYYMPIVVFLGMYSWSTKGGPGVEGNLSLFINVFGDNMMYIAAGIFFLGVMLVFPWKFVFEKRMGIHRMN